MCGWGVISWTGGVSGMVSLRVLDCSGVGRPVIPLCHTAIPATLPFTDPEPESALCCSLSGGIGDQKMAQISCHRTPREPQPVHDPAWTADREGNSEKGS
jgi:hypothetical protein